MSDNISTEEIKRRLILFLRIPAEVWTDVLKLFSRRILVQQISPVCFRLKEISDKNVKTVHVIENAPKLLEELEEADENEEAKKQLEHLAGNKCQLSGQFVLTKIRRLGQEIYFRKRNQAAILLHCPDLFNGCKIVLRFGEMNKSSTMFLECLSELEKAKPIAIEVIQNAEADQIVDYWHHPTILNCTRAKLYYWSSLSAATQMDIFDWLHHQPVGIICGASAADQDRCMIIWSNQSHIDLLINRCSEDIKQAQQPIDRRSFVLSFDCWKWSGFGQFHRIENESTGEVLTLERKMPANGQATNRYRLRRCLTEEEANGAVFYADIFEQDYYEYEAFNFGKEKTTKVVTKPAYSRAFWN